MKRLNIILAMVVLALSAYAQGERATQVLATARKVNDYFILKHADPTADTFVRGKKRPSSLWTRGVYYEGLTALYDIDPKQEDIDYIDRWAKYHQWTPRNGLNTTHADDQCCTQTYLWRYRMTKEKDMLSSVAENFNRQMQTGKADYWWWIDAIQMAMPALAQLSQITGDRQYIDYAMRLYRYTRDEEGGGLMDKKRGLWWRDKRFKPPFVESDGNNCYWSRGNGWVYAALVRVMQELSPDDAYYKELKRDFIKMSKALLNCQREDGLWNASLVSAAWAGKEMTGTSLFLYGMSWGIRNGLLNGRKYGGACHKAWDAMATYCVHDDGFLGFVQGTGAAPSESQPVTYDRAPDFEDFGTGCFLLGATEYYRLLKSSKGCAGLACLSREVKDVWPAALAEAKAGVRWWWMGSAVDDDNMKWCLKEYASAGIGAVEITPIYGVQGNDTVQTPITGRKDGRKRELPFLSKAWMAALQTAEQTGKELGILVDMSTGTGWPFGGPLTPIDEAACKAVFVIDTVATGAAVNKTIDEKEKDYARLLVEKRYATDDGRELVIQLYQSRTRQKVKRAAPGGEGYVVDHFDKDAVRHYLERFETAFSETHTAFPHHFFNDSYEVYGANWTPTLLTTFEKRRGYRLEDHLRELLGLVDDGNKVLSDYRETLADMLQENFACQWTSWAHRHGAGTRCQAHGSPANLIDMYAAADIPETEGFGLSELAIKGLRTDSGMTKKNFSDISMLKYASSAAHITGKPLTSSETFTWLTEHFRTSLSQMKPDLDLMFTCGVNRMFFHGTCYSPKDAAWPGWKFYASVDMSPTNSIWRDAPYLMKYIERSQSFLQMGKPDNDFLVYLPVRDMWKKRLTKGEQGLLMPFDIHSMNKKAPEFIESILKIDSLGYDCDYISDRYLMTTTCNNGMLQTAAGTRYHALIIPGNGEIPSSLKAHLDSLEAQGAKIIWGIKEDDMKTAAKAEPMRSQLHLRSIRRSNDNGHHYFIANLTPHDVDDVVPLAVEYKSATWYDPMNGSITPAEINPEGIRMNFRSGESRILYVTNKVKGQLKAPQPPKGGVVNCLIAQRFACKVTAKRFHKAKRLKELSIVNTPFRGLGGFQLSIINPWTLSFLSSAPEVKKTFHLDRLQTWETLDDDSVKVTMGTGVYSTTFSLTEEEAQGQWRIELGDVRESARVYINGELIGCAWAAPFSLDCKNLRKGKNLLRIEVTNLPANRIAHLDRQGIPWRKFKDINFVDINYKHTTYEKWAPVPSGLNGPVRLVRY